MVYTMVYTNSKLSS